MSDEQYKKLQESLNERDKTIKEQGDQIARLQERELLRDSRDFVETQLETAELPDITKVRLVKALASNPPLKEGKLDEEAYKERIEAAVKEAQAEVAQLLGQRGRIVGQGDGGGESNDEPPKLEEAQKRQNDAFVAMGYGQLYDNGGSE